MDLASIIDHTLLRADTTGDMIEELCREAIRFEFYSVCVNPVWVPLCSSLLKGSAPLVCSVAGFPLGASPTAPLEAERAVSEGAGEIDMVLPLGPFKSGDTKSALRGIADVVKAADGFPVKVILETCLLSDHEKVLACRLSEDAGAAFVKTSTGFAGGGATVTDVRLMRETVGERLGVKASGGVRTRADALAMLEAGASRIGTSSGIKIISEVK